MALERWDFSGVLVSSSLAFSAMLRMSENGVTRASVGVNSPLDCEISKDGDSVWLGMEQESALTSCLKASTDRSSFLNA